MKNCVLVSMFLTSEAIAHRIVTGVEGLKLADGKISPYDGVVIPKFYPEVRLLDIYGAVEFVNNHGLRRC